MTKSNKRKLLSQMKRVDKRLDQFFSILCDDFPELELGTTGSVQYNTYSILVDRNIARKVLSKQNFKNWERLSP